MKFIAALLITTLISIVLSAGILVMAHGHGIWLLVLGVAVFIGMFVRFGCQGH